MIIKLHKNYYKKKQQQQVIPLILGGDFLSQDKGVIVKNEVP